ncbi:hypothetical protein ABW20_dc0109220 [Dactylellina cionopaga]|nr:hypothetical protein ABW20_dc0109220 [Dactylellina cionopaga]
MVGPKDYFRVKFIRNHQSTIIDNTLWIDGGEVLPLNAANYSNATTERLYGPNPFLFSLDLSKPIVGGGDDPNNNIDVLYASGLLKVVDKPSGGGTSSGGAIFNYLWSDPRGGKSNFVQFGGRTGKGVQPDDPLFTYDTASGDSNNLSLRVLDTKVFDGAYLNPHHGAAAQSPDGVAYYLGGMDGNGKYLKQLVKLDLNSGEISVEETGNLPAVVGSQMTWYPIGKKGILVTIGGEMLDSSGRIRTMPIENIWVYDILSSKWYSQVASPADDTQGLPIDRKYFCAVAPGYTESQPSYEFILHGGHRTSSDDPFKLDDIWALTLPTFQWIQYYYGATGNTDGYGAYNVSCAIPNGKYFMVVSTYGFGQDFSSYPFGWYNLETLGWVDYDPDAKGYVRPQIVASTVGKRKAPDSWDDPALKDVFAQAYTRGYTAPSVTTTAGATATSSPTSSTGVPTNGSSSPSDNNNSGNTSPKKNTAAIAAGAAVGSLAVIALCVLVWFLMRRRKRKQLPDVPFVPGKDEPPYPSAAELQSPLTSPSELAAPTYVEIDSHYLPAKPEFQAPSATNLAQLPSAPDEK